MSADLTTKEVAAEMERIFKPLAGRSLVLAPWHNTERQRTARWRLITLTALCLILGITTALAAIYNRSKPSIPSAQKPTVQALSTMAPAPEARVGTARRPPAPPSEMSAELPSAIVPASTVEAPTRRTSHEATVAKANPARRRLPSSAHVLVNNTDRTIAPPVRRPESRQNTLVTRVSETSRARSREPIARSYSRGCEPGSTEDWCIYQDVLNADRRLRFAYRRAERDGVPSASLSRVVRSWRRAREDAEDDPDGTARRYAQLADALDDARLERGR